MRILYQCETCLQSYASEQEAKACEAKPTTKHRFKVDDEVLLIPRHPEDEERIFAKRRVTALLFDAEHKPVYELNTVVETGKRLCEGTPVAFDVSGYHYQPAEEDSLYVLGQLFSFYAGDGDSRIERAITQYDINPAE